MGCSVSRAHKTSSRSFLFKDFPFLHCDLALVSDLFFPKIELFELFYHSYFLTVKTNKGLILPDLAVN